MMRAKGPETQDESIVEKIKINKLGQTLGRKGSKTRQGLIEAASRLLASLPPAEFTALAIAKEANTAPTTFYVYFNDVKDILYEVCALAEKDLAKLDESLAQLWDRKDPVSFARMIVETYHAIWDKNRAIYNFRNTQGDHGNQRFFDLRLKAALPIQEGLCTLILASYPPAQRPRRGLAYAEAIVLHAAIERMAAMDPALLESGLGVKRLKEAEIRILARAIAPHDANDVLSMAESTARSKDPRRS